MKNVKSINLIKLAGAYVAFMIGSGFASGQEIMQFYTSFGKMSIFAILVSMVIFAWSSSAFMKFGHDFKDKLSGGEYQRYCGKYLGKFYEIFAVVLLLGIVVIMISGSGATFNEYYGLPYLVGTGIMAIAIYVTYIFGLRNLVNIIGAIGPIIIVFTILVGIITIAKSGLNLGGVDETIESIGMAKSSSHWLISAVLYCSYNTFGSVIFFNALGAQEGNTRKEASLGGILGAALFMTSAFVMNLAFLGNIGEVGTLAIPTLYLAGKIAPALGVLFSIVLILGIYSTATPMAWSVCDRFVKEGTMQSKIFGAVFMIIAFFGGQLPFGMLVGTIYPYTGYLGILLFVCLAIYQIRNKKSN